MLLTSCQYFKDRIYLFDINNQQYVCETTGDYIEYKDCINLNTKEKFVSIFINNTIIVKVKIKR